MHHVEGRPQVVAHRGSSHDNPEHTLGAYVAALDKGAEGLECDVRLTADGHLVCVHDRRVDRVTQRARGGLHDGAGPARRARLRVLEEPVGGAGRRGARRSTRRPARCSPCARLLDAVRDYDRPVDLAIETKHPTRYAGLVERRLVDLLAERAAGPAADSPARVMSFSPVALTRIKKLAPDLEVVLLIDRQYSWQMATSLLGPGWIAGPGIDLLRENPGSAAGCASGTAGSTSGR